MSPLNEKAHENGNGSQPRRFERELTALGDEVAEAGRSLWLAGLGAAKRAEEEGRDLFDTLVERGRKVEKRQFKSIDRTLADTGRRVRELSERVQTRVEGGFRGTLDRLGVATRDDLEALAGRLEALDRKLQQSETAAKRG